jgi:hypothetical protein
MESKGSEKGLHGEGGGGTTNGLATIAFLLLHIYSQFGAIHGPRSLPESPAIFQAAAMCPC